jgi:hypothetical protein
MQAFVPAKIALQMSESKPVMTGRFYLWVDENIRAVFNTYEDVLDGLKTTVEILSEAPPIWRTRKLKVKWGKP